MLEALPSVSLNLSKGFDLCQWPSMLELRFHTWEVVQELEDEENICPQVHSKCSCCSSSQRFTKNTYHGDNDGVVLPYSHLGPFIFILFFLLELNAPFLGMSESSVPLCYVRLSHLPLSMRTSKFKLPSQQYYPGLQGPRKSIHSYSSPCQSYVATCDSAFPPLLEQKPVTWEQEF